MKLKRNCYKKITIKDLVSSRTNQSNYFTK